MTRGRITAVVILAAAALAVWLFVLDAPGTDETTAPDGSSREDPVVLQTGDAATDPGKTPARPTARVARWTEGRVVSATGRPLRAARVSAAGLSTTSNDLGHFAVEVGAEETHLLVVADGFEPRTVLVPPGEEARHDLGVIELAGRARLRVRVTRDGSAVPDARVAWALARPPHALLDRRRNPALQPEAWREAGRTNASGHCDVPGVPAGRKIVVRAVPHGAGAVATRPLEAPADATTEVEVRIPDLVELGVTSRYVHGGAPIGPVRITRVDGPAASAWQMVLPNPTGRVQLRVPRGTYAASVLAEGRHRLQEEVKLDGPREVELLFDRRQTLRLSVSGPDGPMPAFRVAVRTDRLPAKMAAWTLFQDGAALGTDGELTYALPLASVTPATVDYPKTLMVLVAAPGFVFHRLDRPWTRSESSAEIDVKLRRAAHVVGHAPEGCDRVRLYARVVENGGRWSRALAPRIAEQAPDASHAFSLGTFGPGRYEVRAVGPGGEFTLGLVDVAGDEDVPLSDVTAPATLTIDLPDAALDASSLPVLYRRVASAGWTVGTPHERGFLGGTRRRGQLIFTHVSPGEYTLVGRDVDAPLHELAGHGQSVTLQPGEARRMTWAPPTTFQAWSIALTAPDGVEVGSLAVAALPTANEPSLLPNLAWSVPDARGHATLQIPRATDVTIVVAMLPSTEDFRQQGEAFPLVVRRVRAADAAATLSVAVPRPATLKVSVPQLKHPRILLSVPIWTEALGYHARLEHGRRSPPLMPATYHLRVFHAGADLAAERQVDLAPGESGEITIE